jgi:hypothetical protein
MQISIKTPPELTLPLLEKCAELGSSSPSHFAGDCAFQCIKWMGIPHGPFIPFHLVQRYYHATGREDELRPSPAPKQDALMERMAIENKAKRAKEAAKRLADFRAQTKAHPPSKHLHLKISPGMSDLTERIKAKAAWLRIAPNALVVACLRDCLEAMNDPKKALVPPPCVVEFWAVSHAKRRKKAANVTEVMIMESYEEMLRERGGPILDTIVRLAVSEQWDATLKQILQDTDVLPASRYKQ